jgi:hypothetical protein
MANKSSIKSTRLATALSHRIKDIILHDPGIQRRIAADLAAPVVNVPDDGVVFDPKWQDEFIDQKLPRK